jgi:hypothetical protein
MDEKIRTYFSPFYLLRFASHFGLNSEQKLACDKAWHSRRLAYSDEVLASALPSSEQLIDAIPLFELMEVVSMSDRDDVRSDEQSTQIHGKAE